MSRWAVFSFFHYNTDKNPTQKAGFSLASRSPVESSSATSRPEPFLSVPIPGNGSPLLPRIEILESRNTFCYGLMIVTATFYLLGIIIFQNIHHNRYLLQCGFHLSMQNTISAYFWRFPALYLFHFRSLKNINLQKISVKKCVTDEKCVKFENDSI